MENNTIISFSNVSACYDKQTEILSNVSFNISARAFYFLTGASGAGKTTLLKLIYQLHKPSTGTIKLFGTICNDLSRNMINTLRQKMSIVFQEYSLISHMTVFDNVALPLKVRGISTEKIQKLVSKTLDWVGLGKYANSFPLELSGGQQQRISVARAIIVQPSILLADEPTGNLDEENSSRLLELFIQMNKMFGTTIILATHNNKLIETYKFPVIKIDNHHVAFSGLSGIKTESNVQKTWKGPKPQVQNYFTELSKQFEDIGNV